VDTVSCKDNDEVATTARSIDHLYTEQSEAKAREAHSKIMMADASSLVNESEQEVREFKSQLDKSRSELDPSRFSSSDSARMVPIEDYALTFLQIGTKSSRDLLRHRLINQQIFSGVLDP
jgi:hypothetical protein